MFLAGLRARPKIGWGGQARDDHSVPWSDARQLWPHTLLGWSRILVLAFTVPAHSVCAVHRGRPGAVDPARRHQLMARRSAAR